MPPHLKKSNLLKRRQFELHHLFITKPPAGKIACFDLDSLFKLDQLTLHPKVTDQLRKLAQGNEFPHLLMYGPSGAGKKTRIMAVLRELFGPGVEKLRIEHRTFKINSKTLDLSTVASNYHIEVNPSDAGFHDRVVVQELITEIASNQPLDIVGSMQQRSTEQHHKGFKVVVLNEVDRLTRDAQNALRRTMEKYMSSCRLILCCNSSTRVIEPLRSRCLAIRIAAPSATEIIHSLETVCKKEGMTLPVELAGRIAEQADGNLRKALLMLEASKAAQYPFSASTPVQRMDWEVYISEVATMILQEQSPAALLKVRSKFYELLTHCIPAEIILKQLNYELLKKLDADLKYEVTKWAAFYEHRLHLGSKQIFHLEAFTAKFMSLYKKWTLEMTAGMDYE